MEKVWQIGDSMEEIDRNLSRKTAAALEKGIFTDGPNAPTELGQNKAPTPVSNPASSSTAALTQTNIRFCRKQKGCDKCGGPCSGGCGPSTNDAADSFARVISDMKRRRLEAAAASIDTTTASAAREQQASGSHSFQAHAPRGKRRKTTAPLNFGKVPDWLVANPVVGGVEIHQSHLSHLGWHRGIVWCWHCGSYATRVPIELEKLCEGPTAAGAKALSLLKQGKPPSCKVTWPNPEE